MIAEPPIPPDPDSATPAAAPSLIPSPPSPPSPPLSTSDRSLLFAYFQHHQNLAALAAELDSAASASLFTAPAGSSPLPIAHSSFPIAHSPLPIAHSPLPIAHSPFPIAHSPLPSDRLMPDAQCLVPPPDASPLEAQATDNNEGVLSSPSVASSLSRSVAPPDYFSLLAWLNQPHIQQALADHDAAVARNDRRVALDALREALETADNPTNLRRAATTLLRSTIVRTPDRTPNRQAEGSPCRGCRPPRPPTAGAPESPAASPPSSPHLHQLSPLPPLSPPTDAPAPPPPSITPSPSHTPDTLARRLFASLERNAPAQLEADIRSLCQFPQYHDRTRTLTRLRALLPLPAGARLADPAPHNLTGHPHFPGERVFSAVSTPDNPRLITFCFVRESPSSPWLLFELNTG